MTQTQDPFIGKQLGAYLIQSKLGEGGMAKVYKAYHARLRREVAIKVISAQIADDADFQGRFEQEAQVIASLEHPNIVAVYDFGETDTITYLVMQYIGGGTLRNILPYGRPIEPQRAARYTLQMARALHHAHQRGIVHRDVKPQNMLVSANDPDLLLLSDFGIAKLFGSQESIITNVQAARPQHPALTSASQIVGTAEYMAPEQIQGQTVDARTDVYALGVVLYQMLTGRAPFQASTAVGLMYQHLNTLPKPLRELNPAIPEAMAAITSKALEKAPTARFQSAEAMAQALEALYASTDQLTHKLNQSSYPQPGNSSVSSQRTVIDSRQYPVTTQIFIPTPQSSTARRRVQRTIVSIVSLVALALLVWQLLPWLHIGQTTASNPPGGGNSQTTAFTDTFQAGKEHNWTLGDQNGLSATISSGKYTLTVEDNNTHFPYPQDVSNLPKNFTMTAQITQTAGNTNAVYGLTFDFTSAASGVSTYAFIISSNRNYSFLTYQGNALKKTISGSSNTIHPLKSSNSLKVIAANGQFQFFINDHLMQFADANTLSSNTFTTGQIGLLVSGQPATFDVSQVALTLL